MTPPYQSVLIDPGKAINPQSLRASRQFHHTERNDESVVALLNHVFVEAANTGVSDVHFRDDPAFTTVRYRLGGELSDRYHLTRDAAMSIDSKIRARSKMALAERTSPMSGKFWLDLGDRMLDVRVSMIPSRNGQTIVCRLLDQRNAARRLPDVEMGDAARAALNHALTFAEGLILVAGPTGSGKTSTLYACLNELSQPGVHIVTAEDPIEYELKEATQVQIENPTRSFARVLREFLRQDFDVGLVGEIRDRETATTALEASMTGHLILSTLHANDSVTGVSRMIDLGVEPYSMGAATRAILAQRLEVGMCAHCAEPYDPNEDEKRLLHKLGYVADGAFHVPHVGGCEHCNFRGEFGRVPIIEMLVGSDDVKRAIAARAISELQHIARQQPQFRPLTYAALDLSVNRRLNFHRAIKVTA
jgi:type II secretory ATPase GspE/PulE/Tfp pilus assembly ATPase PilB-like protein